MNNIEKMKLKLNSIYGKQVYNLTKAEKEYLINDIRYTIYSYLFNMCCGKTWLINSFYIDTDSVIATRESKSRILARTRLEFSQLNLVNKRKRGIKYE